MTNRFREIVSVEKIVDDKTHKKYMGLIDSDFIKLINELDQEHDKLLEDYHDLQVMYGLVVSRLGEFYRIMERHNIGSVEKLDKLLGWEYRK